MGPVSFGGMFIVARMAYHGLYAVATLPAHIKHHSSPRVLVRGRKEYLSYLSTH